MWIKLLLAYRSIWTHVVRQQPLSFGLLTVLHVVELICKLQDGNLDFVEAEFG